MFSLSYEMLEVVTFRKENESSFNVGIADVLSKRIASKVLLAALPVDSSVHLRCLESTHEMLLEQLREHKAGYDLVGLSLDSTQHPDLLSKKLGECGVSFSVRHHYRKSPFLSV